MMDEMKLVDCDYEILCSECENCMKHPMKFENGMYEVTDMDCWKCTKHQVHNTYPEMKKVGYTNDVVTGELADKQIKRVFEYAELSIRRMQRGELEIKYKY